MERGIDSLRILTVSPLAGYVTPLLESTFPDSEVAMVTAPGDLRGKVEGRPRFDVALVDLTWHDPRYEWSFDGLDAMTLLRRVDRSTAVVVAVQGHSIEDDHLIEALDPEAFPEVIGAVFKPAGLSDVVGAIRAAATGATLPRPESPTSAALHRYFATRRGRTAARLAASVASGRAARYETLATVARVAPDTASKLSGYLAPLIVERREAPPDEPITQASIYRWCGEHARYLLSWHRRHNPGSPITRWSPEEDA